MSQQKGHHELSTRVYWEDTDAGGIVYHANYVNFMERARTEWLRQHGINQSTLREDHHGMFVVSTISLKYLQPAHLDDLLNVTATVENSGRASITMRQLIYRVNPTEQGQPVLLCEGLVRIGWVDSKSLRPGRIPESVLKQIS